MSAHPTPASLRAVNELLATGDFYSAHQKARTSAARLLKPARTKASSSESPTFDSKAQEAAELLWEGARKLLEQNQIGSGSDLANELVEVWSSKHVACSESERAKVKQLIALIGSTGSWRKTFTDAVFAWTSKTGSGLAGDAEIHGYLGEVFYKEQDFHYASYHLLACPTSDAARVLANLMFEWSKLDKEGQNGVGRYAARGCLSYLESQAISPARVFLSQFLSHVLTSYPSLLVVRFPFPPPSSALASHASAATISEELIVFKLASLNFLQLAVRTCQAGLGDSVEKVKNERGVAREETGKGKQAWLSLLHRYEREIKWLRVGEGKESTQELGTLYFGIKAPRPAGNAMMDMLGSMFGGGPAITGN